MTKLPENPELLKLYRNGMSDKEIAEQFGCTVQAVNLRFVAMGLRQYRQKVTAILESAWPTSETRRGEFVRFNRYRDLTCFLRWRLGDNELTANQIRGAKRFDRAIREGNCVLDFRPDSDEPWTFEPRHESDGRMVIRWPEGRPLPEGALRVALDLPRVPEI
ncbi:hypothetical protein ACFVYF_18750 [Streptomyces sp. NPDC058274]|uniref:hypothetical protein n=1 Tax=Streptomyces sp. NPDC058274 TaxID=3346416 RepID=UPI0036E3C790